MRRLITILLATLLIGCSPVFTQPKNPGMQYYKEIKSWQERTTEHGWTRQDVNEIMSQCLRLAKYESEKPGKDHWKTYHEFLINFKGDCEDIAVFMFGTLRRLGYPHGLKLRAIKMPLGDHAVIMVQMEDGKWVMYNSVPIPGDFFDLALSSFIVDWDETNILYIPIESVDKRIN